MIHPEIYRPGQALFYRGHLPYGLFVLCWGSLVLTSSRRESTTGRRVNAPALVGLRYVLKERHYPFTGVTARESGLGFIPKSLLWEWIEKKEPLIVRHLPALNIRVSGGLSRAMGDRN